MNQDAIDVGVDMVAVKIDNIGAMYNSVKGGCRMKAKNFSLIMAIVSVIAEVFRHLNIEPFYLYCPSGMSETDLLTREERTGLLLQIYEKNSVTKLSESFLRSVNNRIIQKLEAHEHRLTLICNELTLLKIKNASKKRKLV